MLLISAFCYFYSLPCLFSSHVFFFSPSIYHLQFQANHKFHILQFLSSLISCFYLFLSNLFLYLRIIALQNCVGFCQSSTGIIPQSHLAFKLIEQLLFLMGHHVICDAQIICVPLISQLNHIFILDQNCSSFKHSNQVFGKVQIQVCIFIDSQKTILNGNINSIVLIWKMLKTTYFHFDT